MKQVSFHLSSLNRFHFHLIFQLLTILVPKVAEFIAGGCIWSWSCWRYWSYERLLRTSEPGTEPRTEGAKPFATKPDLGGLMKP